MVTTSTHDSKRGEDTSARIAVLSEMPDVWRRALRGWGEIAEQVREPTDSEAAPSRSLEYLFYQTLLGIWPPGWDGRGERQALITRLRQFLAKASKEAGLGVTAIELMPLSSFQGQRGWGYDGVAHFAPFAAYGEPDDLRRFIDEAHGFGLFVVLDVVYNHFGPAGNYLGAYSHSYFTDEYQNAWGQAPDFGRAPMRRYAIDNALYWVQEFRIDGLRFDATHAVFDTSTSHVCVARSVAFV